MLEESKQLLVDVLAQKVNWVCVHSVERRQ